PRRRRMEGDRGGSGRPRRDPSAADERVGWPGRDGVGRRDRHSGFRHRRRRARLGVRVWRRSDRRDARPQARRTPGWVDMRSNRALRVQAIYGVLDDVPLFAASVASIYPYVSGITVITSHDRDWMGRDREPSPLVATILSRELDPDRKIELIVANETNEARTRNRAMDFAAPPRASIRVRRQSDYDRDL